MPTRKKSAVQRSSTMNLRPLSFIRFLAALIIGFASGSGTTWAAEGNNAIAPKLLLDVASPDAAKQVTDAKGVPAGSTIKTDANGCLVSFAPWQKGDADHPEVHIAPSEGKSWDLSAYGHVGAKITNTGTDGFAVIMRVVDEDGGYWRLAKKAEALPVKPGETVLFKVPFGRENLRVAQYLNVRGRFGPQEGCLPKKSKIAHVAVFLYHSSLSHTLRIEGMKAAGAPGEPENPYAELDPESVSIKPRDGVILGKGAAVDLVKAVDANGAKATVRPDGTLPVTFAGGKDESYKIKPAVGSWDLSDATEVHVKFKNVGEVVATPGVCVGANRVTAGKPIPPGDEADVTVSFLPDVTAVIPADPNQKVVGPGQWNAVNWTPQKGTGTDFESNSAKEIVIFSDATAGTKSLVVVALVAGASQVTTPDWLGKRPPMEGNWVQTFAEEFDGPALDNKKWNSSGVPAWDKWTRFSKNNVILKDGTAHLRYEKKTGFHNDDPNDKLGQADYTSGMLSTYGKWTQRYGYFEARVKLPAAPGLWPTFCLLPDRGKSAGEQSVRTSTAKESMDAGVGGMEFDILDFISGWGVYRYSTSCHWDGYIKTHKSSGSPNIYVRLDKEGYVTAGLLWTPGSVVIYNNGREVFRWEGARVGDVESYIAFDLVSGGWTVRDVYVNTRRDDSKLPDDFIIDYVRVWQRKDLATPEDGPKPNKGDPAETKN